MSMKSASIDIPNEIAQVLLAHLFPGDHDEHGAVIAAGVSRTCLGLRLLARDLFLARDGVDYVPGKRGYRMLRAQFICERIAYCRENNLAYLAIHNHGGENSVQFSDDDYASHERGYPALLDLIQGPPVGALVFARNAVAGDIWVPDGRRLELTRARIHGTRIQDVYPEAPRDPGLDSYIHDRQRRIFGDLGQSRLARARVGVIGAGGVGSIVVELLARLGVGEILVADPDLIDPTNLSRIVHATGFDAMTWLRRLGNPAWMRALGERLSAPKTRIATRIARRANRAVRVVGLRDNFANDGVAMQFKDCDFLFLAADSMQARLVFNAIVHQYLVPGIQMGSKVQLDAAGETVENAYSVSRWVVAESGCLQCNQLISPHKLALEAKSDRERTEQAYGVDLPNPSVITMNAVSAAHAVNDFLFAFLGLTEDGASLAYQRYNHLKRQAVLDNPRRDFACTECGLTRVSRRAKGDAVPLPTLKRSE
jgi:hypothetical protein